MAHKAYMSLCALAIGGVCLAAAVTVSLLVGAGGNHVVRAKLGDSLPLKIAGWDGQDLPLGDAEVSSASGRLLNYDDYIYRVYHNGSAEVFIYAMYWKQGS